MTENNDLKIIDFPMKLCWNEKPKTKFLNEIEAFQVELIDFPRDNFRRRCVIASLSTWNYEPVNNLSDNEINEIFLDILKGKLLPNSLEGLIFIFRLKNLTHIEISHLLRHRTMFSIMAVCSGDRDLRHDNVIIPESIQDSDFKKEYLELCEKSKELYARMVDSKKISIMDARYCLTRNHGYDYVVGMNLKIVMEFVRQRMCSQIQPLSDNILAKRIYDRVIEIIPELREVLVFECNKNCHYVNSHLKYNTRLYTPDKVHDKFMYWNRNNYVYKKSRKEMGIKDII